MCLFRAYQCMIEVSHKEMHEMFTTSQIEVFQQNLIDNETEAKRPMQQAEVLAAMKAEKISRKKLVDMVSTLHSLLSETELTLVEIVDAVSEILPSEERAMDLWQHLKYGAPI